MNENTQNTKKEIRNTHASAASRVRKHEKLKITSRKEERKKGAEINKKDTYRYTKKLKKDVIGHSSHTMSLNSCK